MVTTRTPATTSRDEHWIQAAAAVEAGRGRPGWLMRRFLAAPPLLYRVGLANQVGKRFLLLTTTGRRTGRPHTCGLNYVREGDAVYVMAGWGARSDWYRNLRQQPRVTVQIGNERWEGIAAPVDDAAERRRLIGLSARRLAEQGPPRPLRRLLRLVGFDYDAMVKDSLSRGERLPVVAIRPAR